MTTHAASERTPATHDTSNAAIARALGELADRLAERGANPHRVTAYRHAAETVRHTRRPLADALRTGSPDALKDLPGIGDSIASRIAGFVETGRLELLETIKRDFRPERVFGRVAGIGPELARRIHEALGITTLEELELAAHDGRLENVEGFGRGRVQALRDQIGAMLRRQGQRRAQQRRPARAPKPSHPPTGRPPVSVLLGVDEEYRRRAERGELRRIAPRRFNPEGKSWLPILETRRGPWRFRALFSNTARAHRLGKTDDWVVLYAEHDRGGEEQQFTAVTETRGPLARRRTIRGREAECRAFYQNRRPRKAA